MSTRTWFFIAIGCCALAVIALVVAIILLVVWSKKDKSTTTRNKNPEIPASEVSNYDKTVALRPQPKDILSQREAHGQSQPPIPEPAVQMPISPIQQSVQAPPMPQSAEKKVDVFEDSMTTIITPELERNEFDEFDATVVAELVKSEDLHGDEDTDEYNATVLADDSDLQADFRVTRSIIVMHTEEVIF